MLDDNHIPYWHPGRGCYTVLLPFLSALCALVMLIVA